MAYSTTVSGIAAAQAFVSHYSLDRLAGWDMVALQAAAGVAVAEEDDTPVPARVRPDGTLVLNRRLPHYRKRFYRLRACGEAFTGDRFAINGAADRFALAGIISVKETLRRGDAWVAAVLRQLAGMNDAWGARELPRLAAQVREILAMASRDPDYALSAGRLERNSARHRRTRSFYELGLRFAVEAEDWGAYARLHIGLGALAVARGNLPRAKELYDVALEIGESERNADVLGRAHHDLLCLCTEADEEGGEHHATQAAVAYGPRHPRGRYLAHDLACYWISRGRFEDAAGLLELTAPNFDRLGERALPASNIARCAGAMGWSAKFEDSVATVEEDVRRREGRQYASEALLNCAHGAHSLGDAATCQRLAKAARAIARARREGKREFEAEALLKAKPQPVTARALPSAVAADVSRLVAATL